MTNEEIFDVIIVGGGAAGLTAGIYSSRARLSTLILNEEALGGQLVLTEEVANYPGVEGLPAGKYHEKPGQTFWLQDQIQPEY